MERSRPAVRTWLRVALPLAVLAALIAAVRRDRESRRRPPEAGAQRETLVAVPPDVAAAVAAAPADALAEIRTAEERLERTRRELEGVRVEIEARKRDLEGIRDEADADARRSREEMERARQDLEKQRGELEQAASDADRRLREAREAMEEMERQRRAQLEGVAAAGVARGLEGGAAVPPGFDPRLAGRRAPPLVPEAAVVAAAGSRGAVPTVVQGQGPMAAVPPAPTTATGAMLRGQAEMVDAQGRATLNSSQAAINARTAEALELQNRLAAAELFFERRRVNRAARAAEAGPRPSLERIVRYAAAEAPPALDGTRFDRETGDIAWPQPLTDATYAERTADVERRFREQAKWGGSPGPGEDAALVTAIDALIGQLRENVGRYRGGTYGRARTFLDSLRAEAERGPYD